MPTVMTLLMWLKGTDSMYLVFICLIKLVRNCWLFYAFNAQIVCILNKENGCMWKASVTDKAKGVRQGHSKWRWIVSAYPFKKKAGMV